MGTTAEQTFIGCASLKLGFALDGGAALRGLLRDIIEEDDLGAFGLHGLFGGGGEDGLLPVHEEAEPQEEQLDGEGQEHPVRSVAQLTVHDLLDDDGCEGEGDDEGQGLLLPKAPEDEGEDGHLAERAEREHRNEEGEGLVLEERVLQVGLAGRGVPAEDEDSLEATDGEGGLEDLGRRHEALGLLLLSGWGNGLAKEERADEGEEEHDGPAGGLVRGRRGVWKPLLLVVLVEEAQEQEEGEGVEPPAEPAEVKEDGGLVLVGVKIDGFGVLGDESDEGEGEEEHGRDGQVPEAEGGQGQKAARATQVHAGDEGLPVNAAGVIVKEGLMVGGRGLVPKQLVVVLVVLVDEVMEVFLAGLVVGVVGDGMALLDAAEG